MLVETWNQVAGWGIETIKNIKTHVGLGDEDGPNDEWDVPAPTMNSSLGPSCGWTTCRSGTSRRRPRPLIGT